MAAPRRPSSSAFTLFELVLVMVVICAAMALAAPSLRGWSRGARLRDAADQIAALTRLAQSKAVTDATTCRLQIDAATRTCKILVLEGNDFVDAGISAGRADPLPDAWKLDVTIDAADSPDRIDFYANGRCTPAKIKITTDDGEIARVECASPAEPFRLLAPGEVTQ